MYELFFSTDNEDRYKNMKNMTGEITDHLFPIPVELLCKEL